MTTALPISAIYGGGSGDAILKLGVPLATSGTMQAPFSGELIFFLLGAGGGGARAAGSTGGYSGSWGIKRVPVAKGQVITWEVGAPGLGHSINPATAGGNTTLTVGGQAFTAYGGPAGLPAASVGPVANGPAPSEGFDLGANSVKPGWVPGGWTGGAGVDILAKGNNATTSASTSGSGGGGTGCPSVGSQGGGALLIGTSVADALGNIFGATTVGARDDLLGLAFFGGRGSPSAGATGGNGGGGAGGSSSQSGGSGGIGGGGGAGGIPTGSGPSGGGPGGLGGGGGCGSGPGSSGSTSSGGPGGPGYVHLLFIAQA